MIDNLDKFYLSREEIINFFRDYTEVLSDANYNAKQNETKGTGLKILTPKQMLRRLQALAYEACDSMRTPLHTPKTLEMC